MKYFGIVSEAIDLKDPKMKNVHENIHSSVSVINA